VKTQTLAAKALLYLVRDKKNPPKTERWRQTFQHPTADERKGS